MHIFLASLGFALTLLTLPIAYTGAQISSVPLRVPAFTAFIEPDPEGAEVSEEQGVTRWTSGKERVIWYGKFAAAERVDVGISLRLPASTTSLLQLTVAKKALTATATGGAD